MRAQIQDINRRRGKLRSSNQFHTTSAPKWTPRQPRYYKELGEKLGINGDEIHIMMEHALAIQDPTCLKLFERFLFAAKMVSAEPLAEYNRARKDEYDRHLAAVASHERKMKALDQQAKRAKTTNTEIIDQIERRWKRLIDYLAKKAGSIKSRDEFTFDELVVFDVLMECQLAWLEPIRVDKEQALALSFNEICNACSYMEQQLLGPPATWNHHDDDEEDETYDPDWEDIEYWDTGEEVP